MRICFFIAAVCAFTLQGWAQLTPEQAEQRMAELNKHASAPPAARLASTLPASTHPSDATASISGVWRESPTVLVSIVQTGGQFEAQSSYTAEGIGEIRWEMHGTVTSDGKIDGELHHIKAPADWAKSQIREGQVSADSETIAGRAEYDGAWHPFTWTRQREANAGLPASAGLRLTQGAPRDVVDLFSIQPLLRADALSNWERHLKDDKADLAASSRFQDKQQRDENQRALRKRIGEAEAHIEALKSGSVLLSPRLGEQTAKVGQFFTIACKATVLRVVDEQNFVFFYEDQTRPPADGVPAQNTRMWLSGISTVGFVDDADFTSDQIFRIEGTTNGLGTIFLAKPVDTKTYIIAGSE